jgi:integral membrane sensor domain MASE1
MSPHRDPSPLARLPLWATPLVYAALHFVLVAAGLEMQISRPSVAAFWPASGLALATLLLLPRRHWRGILVALCVADLAANLLLRPELPGDGRGLWLSLVGAAEALAGAWLVQRVAGGPVDFSDVRRTLSFIGVVTATTLVSGALVAVPFAGPRFAGDFTENLQAAWIANLLGTVIVAPLLLTFGRLGFAPAARDSGLPPPQARSTLAAFATLTAVLMAVFLRPIGEPRLPIDVPYLVYPALLWVVAIGGTRRVTLAILLTVVFQTVATLHGLGPFAPIAGPGFARAYEVQTFLGLVVLPVLLVSATLLQLRRAGRALADSEQRYRAFVANSSEVIFRAEVVPPVPVSLPAAEQAERIRHGAVIAECNAAFLAAQGLTVDKPGIVGSPLREHPTFSDLYLERIAQWVAGGYQLSGIEHRLPDSRRAAAREHQRRGRGRPPRALLGRGAGRHDAARRRAPGAAPGDATASARRRADEGRRARASQDRRRPARRPGPGPGRRADRAEPARPEDATRPTPDLTPLQRAIDSATTGVRG